MLDCHIFQKQMAVPVTFVLDMIDLHSPSHNRPSPTAGNKLASPVPLTGSLSVCLRIAYISVSTTQSRSQTK